MIKIRTEIHGIENKHIIEKNQQKAKAFFNSKIDNPIVKLIKRENHKLPISTIKEGYHCRY